MFTSQPICLSDRVGQTGRVNRQADRRAVNGAEDHQSAVGGNAPELALVDGKLARQRGRSLRKPALVPRPVGNRCWVNGGVTGPVRPVEVPQTQRSKILHPSGAIRYNSRAHGSRSRRIIPRIQVKNLTRPALPQASYPCLIEGIIAQKIIGGRTEVRHVLSRFGGLAVAQDAVAQYSLGQHGRSCLTHQHRKIPVSTPARSAFIGRLEGDKIGLGFNGSQQFI